MEPSSPAIVVPKGARWDCRGCGLCCRHHVLGPVEPEIVAGIEAHGLDDLWPEHDGRPWIRHQAGPGPPGYYLQKVDGHCVFLMENNHCAVHAKLGMDKKPAFCREYPFTVVQEPRGMAITVREGCGGFYESAVDGRTLEEHAAEVLALPRAYPIQQFGAHPVALVPGLGVAADDWLHLEERICADVLSHDRQPDAHIAAIRDLVLRSVRREPPASDALTAMRATGAMLQVYRMVLDSAMQQDDADDAEVGFARRLRGHVLAAMTTLPRGIPSLDREARDYCSLMLRGFLIGKRFLPYGSVAAGLGSWLHNIRTAALAAERTDAGEVTVHALASVLTDHVRLTQNRSIRQVQKKARPALVDLFHAV